MNIDIWVNVALTIFAVLMAFHFLRTHLKVVNTLQTLAEFATKAESFEDFRDDCKAFIDKEDGTSGTTALIVLLITATMVKKANATQPRYASLSQKDLERLAEANDSGEPL